MERTAFLPTDEWLEAAAANFQRLKGFLAIPEHNGYSPTRDHRHGFGGLVDDDHSRYALGQDGRLRRLYFSRSLTPAKHDEDEGTTFRRPSFWEYLTAYHARQAGFYGEAAA